MRAATDQTFGVFSVLLPGAADPPLALPDPLQTFTCIDLRGGLDDDRAFRDLLAVVTGGRQSAPAVPLASTGNASLNGAGADRDRDAALDESDDGVDQEREALIAAAEAELDEVSARLDKMLQAKRPE